MSSVFLTRTSCRKTIHANGYYGAWPGWAVSVNVLPLTSICVILVKIEYMQSSTFFFFLQVTASHREQRSP